VIDALGAPQTVLLLGGTSEIGLAVLRRLPRSRLRRVVLAGRDPEATGAVAKELAAEGFGGVETVQLDAVDEAAHGELVDAVFDAGDVDLTVLAIGVLGDQLAAEDDPAEAVRIGRATFLGPASLAMHVGRRLRGQGHGTLVVLSSMAAVQARRSNFVYGSAKAGLDALGLGLGDALAPLGVHVVVVRPGFVHTRMTRHLRAAPLASTADAVARSVVDGVRHGRTVVYVPRAMAVLAVALRVLPRRVLRRLPF
jgi:decaprenylphospho-beta-D-erythro-pentofuranosid-2-ulose 2-reductase